jgi:hypothetical protein
MASYLNNYLRGIGAGGFMKDYRHASNLYSASSYRLAPKFRFLYHCVFVLDNSVKYQNYQDNEVGFMVKSVDLPGISFDIEEIKQYNRKSYNYTGVAYNPVSIAFHDDNANNVRNFLANVYNHYTSDGTKTDGEYAVRTGGMKDTYLEASSSATLSWGLDSDFTKQGKGLIKEIQIISLSKGVGSRYTLKNPIITQFSHGSHDQSDGAGVKDSTIAVSYDAYTYADVNIAQIPNFGVAYDRQVGSTSSGLGLDANGIVQNLRSVLDSVPDKNPYDILNTAVQTALQIDSFDNRNLIQNVFGTSLPSTIDQVAKNVNNAFPTATIKKAQEIIKGIKG